MRIYLDSNIFRKTKAASKQFDKAVFDAVQRLKESFIFLFSEGHMHDLSKSEASYRNEDLKEMEKLVSNNYICRDHIKKKLHYYRYTPFEAYETIDFAQMDSFLEDPFTSMQEMFDFEGGEELKNIFDNLFNMPIFNQLDIDTSTLTPEHKHAVEQFQGIKSINDALKSMQGIGMKLDSPKEFKKFRDLLSPFDRKEYSFEEWSFDFDNRMKDTLFGQTFSEMVELTLAGSDKNDEYLRFISAYTQLEALGVTEERSGSKQKLKKNSYWDIHKDAVHAYFASKSDYFVTDDLGVQTKAFIVYRIMGIQTEVLSVKDFLSKSVFLLKNEDTIGTFTGGVIYSLEEGFVINQSVIDNTQVIKLAYPMFNYFNRMQVNATNGERSLQFFRSTKIETDLMFAEVELLIKKCTRLFGTDMDFKGTSTLTDYGKFKDSEFIRKWKSGKSIISLSFEENSYGFKIITITIWF